jgi:hypothetical protein
LLHYLVRILLKHISSYLRVWNLEKDTTCCKNVKHWLHVFILGGFDPKNKQWSLRMDVTRNSSNKIYYNNELKNIIQKYCRKRKTHSRSNRSVPRTVCSNQWIDCVRKMSSGPVVARVSKLFCGHASPYQLPPPRNLSSLLSNCYIGCIL